MKAEGLQYEKKVFKFLQRKNYDVERGIWFEYSDRNGRGYCQPDILLFEPGRLLVLEVKLTQTDRGLLQLEELYLPVLRVAYPDLSVAGVMVCKTLWKEDALLCSSFPNAFASTSNEIQTVHWLGR